MWRYKTIAPIFLVISVVTFVLAGAAQPLEIYGAPDYLGQVVKDTTKELNPGILPTNLEPPQVKPPQAPQPPPQPDNPEPDPEGGKYFTEELKQKIQDYLTLTTVEVAVGAVTAEALQKQDAGTVAPGAYVRLFPSLLPHKHILICLSQTLVYRDLISRAFGVSRTLNDHQEDLVARSLVNLRDEDLQILGALSRRLFECLD